MLVINGGGWEARLTVVRSDFSRKQSMLSSSLWGSALSHVVSHACVYYRLIDLTRFPLLICIASPICK
jgi:hypothetical protein